MARHCLAFGATQEGHGQQGFGILAGASLLLGAIPEEACPLRLYHQLAGVLDLRSSTGPRRRKIAQQTAQAVTLATL